MNLFFRKNFSCLCLLVMIILFSSCSRKAVEIPKNILSKEEFISILVDIHIAQAAMNANVMSDSSRYNMNDYSAYIFKTHHITKEKYDSTMAFYTTQPELMEGIYQEVINELSKKQSEAERK